MDRQHRILTLSVTLSWIATAAGQPRAPTDPSKPYAGQSVVRVDASTPEKLQTILSLTDDVWTHDYPTNPADARGWLDVRLSADALARVRALGIPHRVVIEDLQARVDAERARLDLGANPAAGWYDDYKSLAAINERLDMLAAARPDLARTEVIGPSFEGREIRVIRITGPGDPKDRAAVLLTACQHAREWISPMTAMFIAERLITEYDSDPRTRAFLEASEILVVPVVNPDGYQYSWDEARFWRKNRNGSGIDLNRNWGHEWGGPGSSGNPGDETYRGEAPFSEPETQAVREFVLQNPRIAAGVDLHSYGTMVLSPWGFTDELPPDAAIFDQYNQMLEQAIASVHGEPYAAGPTYTTIYPASGIIQDWMYGDRGVLAWGIELRPNSLYEGGFDPPPDQIVPCAEEQFEALARLAIDRTSALRIGIAELPPDAILPNQPLVFEAFVRPGSEHLLPGSEFVHARNSTDGPFTSYSLKSVGEDRYEAEVPGGQCPAKIQFFLSARSEEGHEVWFPYLGAADPLAVPVLGSMTSYDDPCESESGWTVGAPGDEAYDGIWELADPAGTYNQSEDDHSPLGTLCWVTGAQKGGGKHNVDGGSTTLTSPNLDATGAGAFQQSIARLSYWRWYSSDEVEGLDSLLVSLSGDGGQTWREVESINEPRNEWIYHEVLVSDFVPSTDQVRVRFIASDIGKKTVVEAAIDDITLSVAGCPSSPADLNGDGVRDFFDFLMFVNLYDASLPSADFDGDGQFTLFDFLAFTNEFNK